MPTAAPTATTSSGVKTRSIGWPMSAPMITSSGRDEQGHLEARAVRDGHRELHLVLEGQLDGDEVLGQVADRRDEHHADEERRQAERLDERLDRPDEDLREHGQQDRRAEQDDDAPCGRPRPVPRGPRTARGRRGSRPGS